MSLVGTKSLKYIATQFNATVAQDLTDLQYLLVLAKKAESITITPLEVAAMTSMLKDYILERTTGITVSGRSIHEYGLEDLLKVITKILNDNLSMVPYSAIERECKDLNPEDCKRREDCIRKRWGTSKRKTCGSRPYRKKTAAGIARRLSAVRVPQPGLRLPRCAALPTAAACYSDPNCTFDNKNKTCRGRPGTVRYGYRYKFDKDKNAVFDKVRTGWTPENPYGGSWDD